MFAAFGMGVQEMVILLVIGFLTLAVPAATAAVVILLVRTQGAKESAHAVRPAATVTRAKH